jgi:hypothetical protein
MLRNISARAWRPRIAVQCPFGFAIKGFLVTAFGASLGLISSGAMGGTLTFSDQNSSVSVTPSSSAGMNSWTINGQNVAVQQWFWYAIGSGNQTTLDTLGLTNSGSISVSGSTRGAFATYSGSNGLSVEVDYLLKGGSTIGQSDLSETITLTNTGTGSQPYRFYQYSNFNLSGGTPNDTVSFPSANIVNQTNTTLKMQTVVTPAPNENEAALFNSTLNNLTSGAAYTLNGGTAAGSGDVTWADEWTPTIVGGGTYIISEDQQVNPINPSVPEPSTLGTLFAAGGVALMVGFRWRRRD